MSLILFAGLVFEAKVRGPGMTHIPEGSECDFLPFSDGVGFIAVGWLSSETEYPKGNVSPEFFRALCRLLENPWHPPVACGGVHQCELCRFSGGALDYRFENFTFPGVGSSQLFVPSPRGIFVSPVNVAHYIDAHQFRPSEDFQQAVLECPPMRSMKYLKRLLDGGVRQWQRQMKEGLENMQDELM